MSTKHGLSCSSLTSLNPKAYTIIFQLPWVFKKRGQGGLLHSLLTSRSPKAYAIILQLPWVFKGGGGGEVNILNTENQLSE